MSENLLDLVSSQAVDERVDHWRKKTVEEGGQYAHVRGHFQVWNERCCIDKEPWYVIDGEDTPLGGTGRKSLHSALRRTATWGQKEL